MRTARLSLYGGAVFAPLLGGWLKVLERVNLKSRVATTVAKVSLAELSEETLDRAPSLIYIVMPLRSQQISY